VAFVSGNTAFYSHNLNSELSLDVLGLAAAERGCAPQAAFACLALFFQKVIKPGVPSNDFAGLGNSDTLLGAAMGL
jgi:hypothetical protein